MSTSRRNFLMGCSAAIANLAGSRLTVGPLDPTGEPVQDIAIVVFLRGACDALSVITPLDGEDRGHYETARPDLKIPPASLLSLNAQFGLHPSAVHLHELYQSQKMALVMATGMHSNTRSHFDAMAYMELGTPDDKSRTNGWLTRYWMSAGNVPPEAIIPSVAVSNLQPTSLLGHYDTIAMSQTNTFNLNVGYFNWRTQQQAALRQLYQAGNSGLHQAGLETLDTVQALNSSLGPYVPTVDNYPAGSFGNQLKTLAQLIRLQMGLRIATIDLGGWDTHDGQANGGAPTAGYFASLLGTLSQGLAALYEDLEASDAQITNRLTITVMSEFGRRLRENNERGTDHGHGSFMMVMGGPVNGGQLYGTWPGLHTDQLFDRADLAVTTDYRQVLSEILIRRLQNPKLGYIFPGYSGYNPLGIVQGPDLPPDYSTTLYDLYLPLLNRS